jgi:riboflavin kinase/FMN adenylyltransferase
MKVATSLADIDVSHPAERKRGSAQPQESVVSIGNFDGLHLGHREILKTVVKRAKELGLRSVAMTFSPHPMRFLAPDRPLRLISTLEQKIQLIEKVGIDLVLVAQFDSAFSQLSPEDFIDKYLILGLRARSVCVGQNFNFGYRGKGTTGTLRQFHQHFEIIEIPPVRARGMLVSSSAVRQLVTDGAVSRAGRLLGRWLEIEGKIVPGAGRGRTMEVPTVNLQSDNELIPKIGVYVTRISLDEGPFLDAVTNIGVRPTFDESDLTIETFVVNVAGGIVPAGAGRARLDFLHRLRDERKFPSPEALKQQIAVDVRRAQRFFRTLAPGESLNV